MSRPAAATGTPRNGSAGDSTGTGRSGGHRRLPAWGFAGHRLANWRLRSRMLLLVLVPLIAIVPLAGVRVVSEASSLQGESDIRDQSLIARQISVLVGALGDERDLTEAMLTNHGSTTSQLAAVQRTTTADAAQLGRVLTQYHGSVGALPVATRQLGARAQARLGDVVPLRAAALRLGADAPVFTAYTTIIDDLLSFSAELSASTSDHTLGAMVGALGSVELLEEQTSGERGCLVEVLGSDRFTLERKEDMEQAQAEFSTASDAIIENAPASIRNLYQSTVSGNEVGAADGTVEQVTAAAQEGIPLSSLGIGESTAFDQLTAKLGAIRVVERQVAQDIDRRGSQLLSQGRVQLYGNVGFIVVVLVLSYLGATVLARSVVRPLDKLRSSALDIADNRLPDAVRKLQDTAVTDEEVRVQPISLHTQDEVGQVAKAFDRVHYEAVRLATEQAMMRSGVNSMFTNLSRRSESLVLRQLTLIDELENNEQDPAQLSSLFQLDHLATRMRRNNENLLVLAGEDQGRRWNQPVSLLDVVRAAIAEVESYERVVVGDLPDVAVSGHAATDVVHLVAELIENATVFSAPETEVVVGARLLDTREVVLDIADAGIGIRPEELHRINMRLAQPPVVDVAISRRMGLFVVGRLAAKYDVRVRLSPTTDGGTSALVRLPTVLLTDWSILEGGAGPDFGPAVPPGAQSVPEPHHMPAFEPRPEPVDHRGPRTAPGSQRVVPAGDFPWFVQEADTAAGPEHRGEGSGFTWFGPQNQAAEPGTATGRPEQSPVLGSMEQKWFALGSGGQPAAPPPAPAGEVRREPAPSGQWSTDDLTSRGLPKRVPRDVPDPDTTGAFPRPGTAASQPRSAHLVKDRLSSFHQGIRDRRDASGPDGGGMPPNGSDSP